MWSRWALLIHFSILSDTKWARVSLGTIENNTHANNKFHLHSFSMKKFHLKFHFSRKIWSRLYLQLLFNVFRAKNSSILQTIVFGWEGKKDHLYHKERNPQSEPYEIRHHSDHCGGCHTCNIASSSCHVKYTLIPWTQCLWHLAQTLQHIGWRSWLSCLLL